MFERRLLDDHQSILDVTGWISAQTRTWIETPCTYAKDVRF